MLAVGDVWHIDPRALLRASAESKARLDCVASALDFDSMQEADPAASRRAAEALLGELRKLQASADARIATAVRAVADRLQQRISRPGR